MKLAFLISIISLTAPLTSRAVDPAEKDISTLCPNLELLSHHVKKCQLNPLFIKAANVCLAKLNSEINTKTSSLAVAMGQKNQNTESTQAAKLENHAENLANSKYSLENLRKDSQKIREKIVAYQENMIRAGAVNKKLAAQLSQPFLKILEGFPCYKNNNEVITGYIKQVDEKIQQIEIALGGVSGLANRTIASKEAIGQDSSGQQGPARGTKGLGSSSQAAPAQTSKSSITGVEEDSVKRK